MHTRRLAPEDASAFQALRLLALQDTPSAFGSSYEEDRELPLATVEGRLVIRPDRGFFGAFEGETLVGLVTLGRESMKKLSHKALIWSMYVKPEFRGKGFGRALLFDALSLARSVPEIVQVNLCVNASNSRAIRLYESVGFVAFGREPGAMRINGELHDQVHMYLRLTDG